MIRVRLRAVRRGAIVGLVLLCCAVLMAAPRRRTLRRLHGRTRPKARPAVRRAPPRGQTWAPTHSHHRAVTTGETRGTGVVTAEPPIAEREASTPVIVLGPSAPVADAAVELADPADRSRALVPLALYLLVIIVAELCLVWRAPYASLLIHLALIVALPTHAALMPGRISGMLIALIFAPLIRIVSLALPLASVSPVQAYALACLPLFVSIVSTSRALSLSRAQMGLTWRHIFWQPVIGLLGIPFGILEYVVLRPDPIADPTRPIAVIWATLVLFISTGLLEELMFRGIFQTVAYRLLGMLGLVYLNLVFAALHIGYASLLDVVVVFAIGMVFSWITLRTHSIVGVSLAHGLTNTLLFIVLPTFWPLP